MPHVAAAPPAAPATPRGRTGPARPAGPTDPVAARPEPPLRVLVGAVLRRHRERQGRTLRDVADAARVSVPYLSEVERGRKEASSEVLGAVCRALGLRLVDLVGDAHAVLARAEGRVVVDLATAPGAGHAPRSPVTPLPTTRPPSRTALLLAA
ncbi:helix-turn-helix domain-containing protein [Cellulomonas sp. PS-H5]|uniref:helix-turn-helix domain-containing protein n=1 Tax=Cellulomonas sp. PS-H5 TaxID=2820400 RepID=UPI001C4FEE70|nr:helix-turn-helix transcriptional regulator [Cellulomonas sp. PS-H5]MBW0253554.1 helix-turn-helix transcriptional regulator [Cellulomonas sp. PS-H5]